MSMPMNKLLNGKSHGQKKAVLDRAGLLRWYGIDVVAHLQVGSQSVPGFLGNDLRAVLCLFCADILSILGVGSLAIFLYVPFGYDLNVTSSNSRRLAGP